MHSGTLYSCPSLLKVPQHKQIIVGISFRRIETERPPPTPRLAVNAHLDLRAQPQSSDNMYLNSVSYIHAFKSYLGIYSIDVSAS